MRTLLTLSFLAVLLWWLRYEFKRTVSFTKYWAWLVAALVVQTLSIFLSLAVSDPIVGNFLYHAIGGGVTSCLLFIYLIKTYEVHVSWRVELVLLYCFVSALGVMNELAEYAGEFFVGTGSFSWDAHDTWRDLVANTAGAVLAWLAYRVCSALVSSRQNSSLQKTFHGRSELFTTNATLLP